MAIDLNLKERTAFAKEHIHEKLIRRLKIFIIMFVGMLGFIVYDVIRHGFDPLIIICGFILGIIIGALAGRMFNIQWHKETEKVVANLDTGGIIILVIYIAFSIFRQNILGVWIHGPVLATFSFSLATGAILGRILSINVRIRNVLNSQGIQRNM